MDSESRHLYDLELYTTPGTPRNPFALDHAVNEDGISLYDPRPWDEQAEAYRAAHEVASSTLTHLAHFSGCQDSGATFVIAWCGIALDEHDQHHGTAAAVDSSQMCPACVNVIRSGGRCPSCGSSVDDLIRRES